MQRILLLVERSNVPTEAQLKAEIDIWGTTNYADISAFNSVLKLPVAALANSA
jgi:hypothetical protein